MKRNYSNECTLMTASIDNLSLIACSCPISSGHSIAWIRGISNCDKIDWNLEIENFQWKRQQHCCQSPYFFIIVLYFFIAFGIISFQFFARKLKKISLNNNSWQQMMCGDWIFGYGVLVVTLTGKCDLSKITKKKLLDVKRLELIKKKLTQIIPGVAVDSKMKINHFLSTHCSEQFGRDVHHHLNLPTPKEQSSSRSESTNTQRTCLTPSKSFDSFFNCD